MCVCVGGGGEKKGGGRERRKRGNGKGRGDKKERKGCGRWGGRRKKGKENINVLEGRSVGVRTSFSTCNVAKYYYSESSQLGDTTL